MTTFGSFLHLSLFYVCFLALLFLLVSFRTVEAGRRVTNNHHNHNHHNTIFQCDSPQNTENALYNAVFRSLYSRYSDVCKKKQYQVCPVSNDTCGYDKCLKQTIEEKENPRENLPARFAPINLALSDNVPCIAQNLLTNYLSEIPEHELETIQTIEKLIKDEEDVRNKHLHELELKREEEKKEEKKILDEKKRLEEIEEYNKRYEETWLARWIVSTIALFMLSMCIIPERYLYLIFKYLYLIFKYFKNHISTPIKRWLYPPKRYNDRRCPVCWHDTEDYANCGHALCYDCYKLLDSSNGKKCPYCSESITEIIT